MVAVANRAMASGSAPPPIERYLFDEEADEFRKNFNRDTFSFRHRLADHPLFETPRLIQLARTCARHPKARPDEVYFDAGDVKIDQRWEHADHPSISPEEVLDRIQTAGAWMMIRRAELVDDYRVILEDCMREIGELVGVDLDDVMKVKNAIVFITSPQRVTSYHIDRECNFLLQISGQKALSVFHRTDRVVLPEVEIERYWAVDNNAALYKPELQHRAHVHHMKPGDGVHIPVNAPHWVQNGDRPSVSLSINFEFEARTKSDVYRANYFLRRLGLAPTPPGQSELKDRAKRLALPVMQGAFGIAYNVKRRVGLGRGSAPRRPTRSM
jgi:cupin superfamily protein